MPFWRWIIPLLCGLVLFSTPTAHAASHHEPLIIPGNSLLTRNTTIERSQRVTFNEAALAHNVFSLPLFGTTYTASITDTHAGNVYSGHLVGVERSSIYISVVDGIAHAEIRAKGEVYAIRYDGHSHLLVHLDQYAMMPDPDDMVTPEHTPEGVYKPQAIGPTTSHPDATVMVVYTTAAKNDFGGTAAIEAAINTAVAATNDVLTSSNVNGSISLVHTHENTTYTETDSDTALDDITYMNDGKLEEVHQLRNDYAADFVAFIASTTSGPCGVAWFNSDPSSVSFENFAFSFNKTSCFGNYLFAHELGHNMGMNHEWAIAPTNVPYPYAHGYTDVANGFFTTLSYGTECVGPCDWAPHYSNPDVLYNGHPTGSTDASTPANNARVADDHFATYTQFRTETTDPPPNGDPTNLIATYDAINNDIDLEWDDNATNEDAYTVERRADGGAWATLALALTADTITYADTDITCGTTYDYRVKASNTNGDSGYSNIATENTPACAVDSDPTNLAATYNAVNAAIDLAWDDNATNEDNYAVERKEAGSTTWAILDDALPADSQTYTDAAVVCGLTYEYRVKATNIDGESGYSNMAEATTSACIAGPNGDPTDVSAFYFSAPHEVDLTWVDAATNEDAYTIERKKAAAADWVTLGTSTADTTIFTDATVTCDQDYVYRVTATNAGGEGTAVESNTVTTACNIFSDVPSGEQPPFFEAWIEDFYQAGITEGCNGGEPGVDFDFCPTTEVNRGQMAVFILRALAYPGEHTPIGIDPNPFDDVPSPNLPPFFEAWIEDFLSLGITTGCNAEGTLFCPEANVDRGQMAVFILRAIEGEDYVPQGIDPNPFVDVPSADQPPAWEDWIEDFYSRGITTGCNNGVKGVDLEFCPGVTVDRGQMALFILRAFDDIPDPDDG